MLTCVYLTASGGWSSEGPDPASINGLLPLCPTKGTLAACGSAASMSPPTVYNLTALGPGSLRGSSRFAALPAARAPLRRAGQRGMGADNIYVRPQLTRQLLGRCRWTVAVNGTLHCPAWSRRPQRPRWTPPTRSLTHRRARLQLALPSRMIRLAIRRRRSSSHTIPSECGSPMV